MTEPFPDVEIYIKNPNQDKILRWLGEIFGGISVEGEPLNDKAKKVTLIVKNGVDLIPCVFFPNAVKGKFASLWFKSGATPWNTDRDCALSAFEYLQTEIRCSMGPWKPDDGQNDESWLCINADGESTVVWKS